MPSSRQYRVIGMVALLTLLVLYYVTNGERLTHDNEFYKKTVAAIEHKKDAAARQHVIEEEKVRQDRVERLQKEHDAAMATATATTEAGGAATDEARTGQKPEKQKPIVEDAKKESSGEKSVAGRKKMKDGKVVDDKPASDKDDGVAKVGNVEPKTTSVAKGEEAEDDEESEREHRVELELNSILKKGPIIIFSKSYCPYSKKAKHILLDLYTISPPPYVVELDEHPLGSGLQDALQKSTGRRTVPNILINGKSIGGGDDVQALHQDERLIETVKAMGGKRIMEMARKDSTQQKESETERERQHQQKQQQRAEVKFKA